MKSNWTCFALGLCSCLMINLLPGTKEEGDTSQKISELESRIEKLESIVYASSKLNPLEAERRLRNAELSYAHSRKLRQKGFINEAQLKNDEFAVKQAKHDLQLARGQADEARLGAELDLMNAQQDLANAKRELEYTKKLNAKGFATSYDVQQRERVVRRFEQIVAGIERRAKLIGPVSDNSNNSMAEPQKPTKSTGG